MRCVVDGVKRHYDSSARRARAEQVRALLVDTARDMLLRDGYAATTIPKLAHACGVSAESVYKRFAGKPALVRAVVAQALQGSGLVPAETRSDALPAADLKSLLQGWAALGAEVAPRVAPILLMLRAAAAHEPELAGVASAVDEDRRARMRDNARRISAAGHLPSGMSLQRAGDVLWAYSSAQIYELLVLRCGWNLEQYADFIAAGMAAQLSAAS